MSPSLAAQQTELLDMLYLNAINIVADSVDSMPANSHFCFKNKASTLRGLRAYRANAQELSVQALRASYPVLQQLLGEENFAHLAQDFWQAMPPERGDLAQWGGELATYLPRVPALQTLLAEYAFLPDIARVEWALHESATASDATLDVESFQRLTKEDPAQLRLHLGPGCALLRSAYPVVSIMQLHDARLSDTHAAARSAIANGEPQTALVWRQGFRPMVVCVQAPSAALIEATLQGQSLSQAWDAAASANEFDFSAWLSTSVQTGLLVGVR